MLQVSAYLLISLPELAEPPHEVVAELNDFISLLLNVLCIVRVGNLDDSSSCGRLKKSFLEFNLVLEKLVCVLGGQVVLLLNVKEVLSSKRLVWIRNELLNQFRSSPRRQVRQDYLLTTTTALPVLKQSLCSILWSHRRSPLSFSNHRIQRLV